MVFSSKNIKKFKEQEKVNFIFSKLDKSVITEYNTLVKSETGLDNWGLVKFKGFLLFEAMAYFWLLEMYTVYNDFISEEKIGDIIKLDDMNAVLTDGKFLATLRFPFRNKVVKDIKFKVNKSKKGPKKIISAVFYQNKYKLNEWYKGLYLYVIHFISLLVFVYAEAYWYESLIFRYRFIYPVYYKENLEGLQGNYTQVNTWCTEFVRVYNYLEALDLVSRLEEPEVINFYKKYDLMLYKGSYAKAYKTVKTRMKGEVKEDNKSNWVILDLWERFLVSLRANFIFRGKRSFKLFDGFIRSLKTRLRKVKAFALYLYKCAPILDLKLRKRGRKMLRWTELMSKKKQMQFIMRSLILSAKGKGRTRGLEINELNKLGGLLKNTHLQMLEQYKENFKKGIRKTKSTGFTTGKVAKHKRKLTEVERRALDVIRFKRKRLLSKRKYFGKLLVK